MPSITLAVIFNHPYPKNIQILREVYSPLVDRLVFLHPFQDIEGDDIVRVYHSGHHFHGYLAYALEKLQCNPTDLYLFIADDLLLNPSFLKDRSWMIRLGQDATVISMWKFYRPEMWQWPHTCSVLSRFSLPGTAASLGVENWKSELPCSKELEKRIIERFGDSGEIHEPVPELLDQLSHVNKAVTQELLVNLRRTGKPYPLTFGISDLFAIRGHMLRTVSSKLGVMAALGVFVEVAIPTILLACSSKIASLEDLKIDYDWTFGLNKDVSILTPTSKQELSDLIDHMPENTLFCHPIKLSKIA